MKLTILGTGHAMVTECYNTCFVLSDGSRHFLVDGGGNGLIRQLRRADIRPKDIGDIFVTHRHTDHIMGILWMLREFSHAGPPGAPKREVNTYSHGEVITILKTMAERLNVEKLILYHTEDQSIADRKRLYTEEGRRYFSGSLYVPDDLEVIDIE